MMFVHVATILEKMPTFNNVSDQNEQQIEDDDDITRIIDQLLETENNELKQPEES